MRIVEIVGKLRACRTENVDVGNFCGSAESGKPRISIIIHTDVSFRFFISEFFAVSFDGDEEFASVISFHRQFISVGEVDFGYDGKFPALRRSRNDFGFSRSVKHQAIG